MIPAPFAYEAAESVEHALSLLNEREDAKLLAGGHSLLPLLRLRITRPALLVDIGELSELSYIRDETDALAIGALTRHHDLATSALVQEHNPLVSYAARLIGDPQVRHRGTIGGSLAHGDPASDLPAGRPPPGGSGPVQGARGPRALTACGRFPAHIRTAPGGARVHTGVRIPAPAGRGFG